MKIKQNILFQKNKSLKDRPVKTVLTVEGSTKALVAVPYVTPTAAGLYAEDGTFTSWNTLVANGDVSVYDSYKFNSINYYNNWIK